MQLSNVRSPFSAIGPLSFLFAFHRATRAVLPALLLLSWVQAASAVSEIRINAGKGGSDYTDQLGQVWIRDTYFSLGGTVSAPGVSGTPENHLYRIARSSLYTNFFYDIPVDNGQYAVTLKFAETTYSRAGQRIFDVVINGQTVLDDFDILAEVPARFALDKTFDVTVTNGLVEIDFVRGNRNGIVSAIEIVPSGPPPLDTTAPVRSAGSPSGSLPSGTTQADLALSTDEDASCRYSTAAGQDYAVMAGIFASTGGRQHSTPLSGLQDGESYLFYVRCEDGASNPNTDDFAIGFDVDVPPPPALSITSPTAGAALSGAALIEAAAQGPDIAGVTFFIDGQPLGVEDPAAPFSASWDTTLFSDGPFAISARLRYGTPQTTLDSPAVNVTVDNSGPPAGLSTIRINAGKGSGDYTDQLGQVWMRDTYFTLGGQVSAPGVSGTPENHLYRIARSSLYTDFYYDIPVDNGQYAVTLKFAETTYSQPGQRIFDVVINGDAVLNDFDILAEVPARYALDKTFEIGVTNGLVEIDFVRGNRYGIVSAIEIVPSGPPPPDTTAPVRSAGSPSGPLPPGTTTSTLSLSTDEDAVCRYSSTADVSFEAMTMSFDTTGGRQHQTSLSGLADGQSYSRHVRCQDSADNANLNDFLIEFSVQEPPPPPPPSISISSPASGAVVSGIVTIQGLAGGPNVQGVSFFVDGQPLGAEDASLPFEAQWDTVPAAAGAHTLTARLRYGSPETTLDAPAVNVTVDNSAPAGGSEIRINSGRGGSVEYTDGNGDVWSPDQYHTGGTTKSTTAVIAGTAEQDLYRYIRDGLHHSTILYHIPVEDGAYVVTLKFAEIEQLSPGARILDIVVNGQRVLRNLDLAADVGVRTAFDATVKTEVADGLMRVFITQVIPGRRPVISAIGLEPASGAQRTDLTPPLRSLAAPNGPLAAGTVQTTLQLNTNENAVCRYSTTEDGPFSSMSGTFDTTGGTVHSTNVAGLVVGSTSVYRVRCRDAALNENLDDIRFVFSVPASASSPAPAVSFPADGATVSGNVNLTAEVTGGAADSLQFYLDGVPLGPPMTQAPYTFAWNTLLAFNGDRRLTVRARYGGSNEAVSLPVDVTVANTLPAPGSSTVRLHSGSLFTDFVDPGGTVWGRDLYFQGGQTRTISRVYRTHLPDLYRVTRYSPSGSFSYSIPLADGRYRVRLLLSEVVHTAPGSRVFDVTLNGAKALENFDILEEAAPKEPLEKTFQAIVDNGVLEIGFDSVTGGAIVSAIEVTPAP